MNQELPQLKFHHIGALTRDICVSERTFSSLGFSFESRIFDPIQQVNLSFGRNHLGMLLELVEPVTGSSIEPLMKRNGPGPYHLCFEVENIHVREIELKKQGFLCTRKPEKAIAFDNRLVSFYYSIHSGLVELLEL